VLRIAVVDDERRIREQLEGLIVQNIPGCALDTYACGEVLLDCKRAYDVIFLDIGMEGMGGMETARALRAQGEGCILVFVTAIREQVFEAFDVGAFHYLLKPIDEGRFAQVLRKAAAEAQKRGEGKDAPLRFKSGGRSLTLPRADILYAENRGKKIELHTQGEVFAIYASMRELEAKLGAGFFRSHRGYLVNMAHIRSYDGSSIGLGNGERLLLARERYSGFVKTYMRYLREGGESHV